MSNVVWVIERFRSDEDAEFERLVKEVRRQGHIVYEYHPYRGLPKEAAEDIALHPTVFHGTCAGARMFSYHYPGAMPGVFTNWSNYACSSFLTEWKDLCLNYEDGEFITLGRLEHEDFQYPLFIRPDNGDKLFDGQVLASKEQALRLLEQVGGYKSNAGRTLCLISKVKNIGKEWRVFYHAGLKTTLGSSLYRENGVLSTKQMQSAMVEIQVKMWMTENDWVPDEIFAIDVAEDKNDGTFKIIEASAVNVAGLYKTELGLLVREMGKHAEKTWTRPDLLRLKSSRGPDGDCFLIADRRREDLVPLDSLLTQLGEEGRKQLYEAAFQGYSKEIKALLLEKQSAKFGGTVN